MAITSYSTLKTAIENWSHRSDLVAIINPPETAILAVGSTTKEVQVSEDNSLRIREVMKMTLSADHRAVDGVLASRFLNRVKSGLEHPQTLLG